jgi:hypothetical protein
MADTCTKATKRRFLDLYDDEADGARVYDAAVALQNLNNPRNIPGDAPPIPRKVKSRFFGVGWDKQSKKWRVQALVEGKKKHIGYYDDETAAALAFDAYVIPNKIDKDLNFPSAPGAAGHTTTKKKGSRHRGVCWDKRRNKWRATTYVGGKQKSLGAFIDEDDAGRAYDAYIRKHCPHDQPKGWKRFNFPSADGEEGGDGGGDDPAARSARGGASSSSAAVDARTEEEEEEEASSSEEEEPPRRRRRHRDTRT